MVFEALFRRRMQRNWEEPKPEESAPSPIEGDFSVEERVLLERAVSEAALKLREHLPLAQNPLMTEEKIRKEALLFVMGTLSKVQARAQILDQENKGGTEANKASMIQEFAGVPTIGMSESTAKEIVESIVLKER